MTLFILLAAEFIFGIVVGFILSDNKKGLSIEEAKMSSVLFLIATAVVLWQNPDMSGSVFAELALSWFVLLAGVLVGELIKMKLISNIIHAIKKKDIQLAMNEMVQLAGEIQYSRRASDSDRLYHKLYEVQGSLKALSEKSKGIQSESFMNKLRYLFELCEDYVGLSITIKGDVHEGKASQDTIDTWLAIGKELTSLSWDTLNHAEENVKNELGKAFSMKVVHRAVSKR